MTGAADFGGEEELLVHEAEDLAANDACGGKPFDGADGDEEENQAALEDDGEEDDEGHEGEAVKDVDEAHHGVVDATTGHA